MGLANALPRLPGNLRQGSPRRLRQALGSESREKETPGEAWPGGLEGGVGYRLHAVATGSRKGPQSNSRLHSASRSWGPGRTSAVQSASDCERWGRGGEPGKAGPGASLGGWPCPSAGPASLGKGHVAGAQARPRAPQGGPARRKALVAARAPETRWGTRLAPRFWLKFGAGKLGGPGESGPGDAGIRLRGGLFLRGDGGPTRRGPAGVERALQGSGSVLSSCSFPSIRIPLESRCP